MINNGKKLNIHYKSGKQDYQIYIYQHQGIKSNTQCFSIYFIVQNITFLTVTGIKCLSIVFLRLNDQITPRPPAPPHTQIFFYIIFFSNITMFSAENYVPQHTHWFRRQRADKAHFTVFIV